MLLQKCPLVFVFFFCCAFLSYAQNMQEGFTYLETGNYTKAVTYFKEILKTYPKNKTARLCYGRAIGLEGNSEEALKLFTNLLNDFPNDFEVKLNYAEALLWHKEFIKAEVFYKKLLEKNKQSFPTLLGYANTLSNLKIYTDALTFVNKSLEIQPNNDNALISKKYIRLGLAYEKGTSQNYEEAEKILQQVLLDFPNDQEALANLANLYLISNQNKKAQKTYETLGEVKKNKVLSLNGLALVKHLEGKNKEALNISEKAIALTLKDTILKKQTQERYIQALIWNKKYKLAKQKIDFLIKNKGTKNWILALRATLNIYKSNFKESLADYNIILKSDSTSFDGNLGKANTLKALNDYKNAYKSAEKTLTFYKKQKDATNFIQKLNQQFTPFVKIKTSYSFDNGNNKANSYITNLEFPFSTKFKVLSNYKHRITRNSIINTKATSNIFLIGLEYQIFSNIFFKGKLGLINANAITNNYTQSLTNLSLNIKPYKLQNLELKYTKDLQDFNADLVNREIVQQNFIVNYNVNTNFNLGSFVQYYYTRQNDNNTRNLLFSSLYYTFTDKPGIKAGINYQNISFKNQVPTVYFSPENFNAIEVFVNLIKSENITQKKEWFYELTAATGFQFIENNNKQTTYRIQGKLGYKISKRALLNLYGIQSNIASTTASGFTFTEIGLRFKWYLNKKPNFRQ